MHSHTFVGRDEVLATLEASWRETIGGNPRVALIEGAEGSGRRTLVSELLNRPTDGARPLGVRLAFTEGEDGLKVLLRLYAALFSALHADADLKASTLALVDELQPQATEPRNQWLQAFREGMEKEAPDLSAASFQVTIPRQSPYLAFQELLAILAPKHPVVLELGDADHVLSFTFWTFVTALLDRIRFQKLPIFVVIWGQPLGDPELEALPFSPRKAVLDQLPAEVPVTHITLEPLSEEEVGRLVAARYAANRFPEGFAAKLHALTGGLPGRLTDLFDLMEEREILAQADDDSWILKGSVAELEWDELMPALPKENAALARQVLQVAAMEGRVFTASIVSEQLSVDKDTVDDLLDELEDIVEEMVFHEGIQSWLYRFKSPLLRRVFADDLEGVARKELARGLGGLLERSYLQRSVEYALKAARLYREADESRRAVSLVGLAASAERPDILQMGAELVKAFPQTAFPPALYKGLHLTLLEKVAPTGPVEPLLQLTEDVEQWATARDDQDIAPWLAFYRARLLQRAANFKEAVKFAEKAQKGFARQNNAVKEADSFNILALIALGQGEMGVANEHVGRALKKTEFAPIKAQALFIRGIIQKNRGEFQPALDSLKEALDLSGRSGVLPLHLDSGLNIAEILLMNGKADEAINLLKQLLEVSRQTRQPGRERAALSLLAKAQAGLKDFQQAIDFGSQALKLSREMKIKPLEAADLLDLGIFSFVRGQADEGSVYLRESEKLAREIGDPRLLKETLFHQAMICASVQDFQRAHKFYQDALKVARDLKDERREANILFNIGGLYLEQKEFARARTFLDQAAPLIEKIGSPDEKKLLQKAKERLEVALH